LHVSLRPDAANLKGPSKVFLVLSLRQAVECCRRNAMGQAWTK
jgi:hypothetical protein